MNKKMNNKGFSLVELIVVIAIMAILVGALAPQFIKYVEKSRQSTDMQNIAEMKSAIEVYAADKENATGTLNIALTGTSASFDNSAASNAGIASTISLKSKGWSAISAGYSLTDYKWSTSGTTVNGKDPGNNIADIFLK